jgi:argininosuccinate lyase
MRAAVASSMMATDLADYLVGRGVSFREAHASVGKLVRECEETGQELHSLPRASFAAAHAMFGDDVFDALSPLASVERREVDGGTGPVAVRAQLEAATVSLTPGIETSRGNELNLRVG